MGSRMNWNRAKVRHSTSDDFNPLASRAAQAERAWFGDVQVDKRLNRRKRPGKRARQSSGPPAPTMQALEAKDRLSAVTSATVHCDGACEPNPGPGGWGLLIDTHSIHRIELCGGDSATTNNRMEITAAIVALSVLPVHCATVIVTDSQYVVKGATSWMAGWRRKGFQRHGGDMPNADLWRALDALITGRAVTWQWVRGHNGHGDNERADVLANIGLRQSAVDCRRNGA